MIQVNWLQLAKRAFLAWVLAAGFFYCLGEAIVGILLPWLQWIANLLSADYQAKLSLGASEQGVVINIVATVTHNIYQYSIPIAPAGAQLTGAGTLSHALTPLVILFSVMCTWPGTLRVITRRVLLGLPIGLALLSCTLPFLLVSHIEEIFYTALQNVMQKPMPMPRIMVWVMFIEMGGLWLLPIVGALGCVAAAEHFKIPMGSLSLKTSVESAKSAHVLGASNKR